MHSVKCPSCDTSVESDFRPVAGKVWCPDCEKLFSPRSSAPERSSETDQVDQHSTQNGRTD
jgi:hypothetical protein